MKVALSAVSLLLAANLPYAILIIRRRSELPAYWKRALLLLFLRKIRPLLMCLMIMAVIVGVFALLNWLAAHGLNRY